MSAKSAVFFLFASFSSYTNENRTPSTYLLSCSVFVCELNTFVNVILLSLNFVSYTCRAESNCCDHVQCVRRFEELCLFLWPWTESSITLIFCFFGRLVLAYKLLQNTVHAPTVRGVFTCGLCRLSPVVSCSPIGHSFNPRWITAALPHFCAISSVPISTQVLHETQSFHRQSALSRNELLPLLSSSLRD